jgi:hypothetical protein
VFAPDCVSQVQLRLDDVTEAGTRFKSPRSDGVVTARRADADVLLDVPIPPIGFAVLLEEDART